MGFKSPYWYMLKAVGYHPPDKLHLRSHGQYSSDGLITGHELLKALIQVSMGFYNTNNVSSYTCHAG